MSFAAKLQRTIYSRPEQISGFRDNLKFLATADNPEVRRMSLGVAPVGRLPVPLKLRRELVA
jgi:hypothetical protein